jgi:hypothetical protein
MSYTDGSVESRSGSLDEGIAWLSPEAAEVRSSGQHLAAS